MDIFKFSPSEFEFKISIFHSYINEITLKNAELSFEERRLKISETLKFDQFFYKLRTIFGHDLDESFSKNFFKKICQNPDSNVDWSELFGYTIDDHKQDKNLSKDEQAVNEELEEVQIFMAPYRFRIGDASGDKARRDIIQCIYHAPDIDSFITVAQKGAVSIWSSKLKLHGCTFLKEQIDGWLNGCCYLPNIKRIVITAERSLTFWDLRNNKQSKSTNNMSLLSIQGMTALTCLDSINKYNHHKESDKLIMGDSFGNIMTIEVNINDLSSNNTKPDLVDPQKRVIDLDSFKNSLIKKKIHDESVIKIKYIPELSSFISCSSSEKISLVIEELVKFETKDAKINRQVGISKGCNTFCYCSKLNLIATGGVDKAIRMFNPLVLNKTCGKLIGHLFTIVDLVCNEKDQQLISLSSERVFRVWDLTTFKCLQVFSDTESRPGEKRIFCLSFDQKRDRLLTCSSVLDCWPLTRSVHDTLLPPHTHDRPLVATCFSENQIATICTESTLKVWEGDTGRLLYSMKKIHGSNVNVTCMAADPNGNRLATGGYDGSIKIWNFATGQELKHKLGVKLADASKEPKTISIHYANIKNELCIIVCDLNNIIKIYHDSNDSNELILLQVLSKSTGRASSFKKYDVIPPINTSPNAEHNDMSTELEEHQPRLNQLQLIKLFSHRIKSSYYFHENNWLLVGSKYVAIWDIVSQYPKDIFGIENDNSKKNNKFDNDEPQEDGDEKINNNENNTNNVTTEENKENENIEENNEIKTINDDEINDDTNANTNKNRNTTTNLDYLRLESRKSAYSVKSMRSAKSIRISGSGKSFLLPRINCIKVISNKRKKVEFREVLVDLDEESVKNDKEDDKDKDKSETPIDHKDTNSSRKSVSETSDDETNDQVDTVEEKKVEPIEPQPQKTTFKFIVVTAHDDAVVKLWNEQGDIIGELPSINAIKQAPVTALSIDPEKKYLYTGDMNGYITIWSIAEFLNTYDLNEKIDLTENYSKFTMVICWRAHLTKIVNLVYVPKNKILLSASTDESVRAWCASKGKYVGFLGQTKIFLKPSPESEWVAPYDITETPVYFNRAKVDNKKTIEKNYEYPLILDKKKLTNKGFNDQPPVVRFPTISSVNFNKNESRHSFLPSEKYFTALVKPKHSFNEAEIQSRSIATEGSIFSTLPLYKESNTFENHDIRNLLLSNPYRLNKEVTYLMNEKKQGPKVNFKANVKIIK